MTNIVLQQHDILSFVLDNHAELHQGFCLQGCLQNDKKIHSKSDLGAWHHYSDLWWQRFILWASGPLVVIFTVCLLLDCSCWVWLLLTSSILQWNDISWRKFFACLKQWTIFRFLNNALTLVIFVQEIWGHGFDKWWFNCKINLKTEDLCEKAWVLMIYSMLDFHSVLNEAKLRSVSSITCSFFHR